MKTKNTWIFFILALAFFLRVIPINQSYWLDEAINIRAVQRFGIKELVTQYAIGDFHPPLYHMVLKIWTTFTGYQERSTRALSIIFGLVTIYYLYLISVKVFGSKKLELDFLQIDLRLLPVLLLATSGLHVYYSGEARMYSLAAMFTCMSIYYSLILIDKVRVKADLQSSWRFIKENLELLTQPRRWLSSLSNIPSTLLIISLLGMLLSDYVPWLLLPLFLLIAPIQTVIAILLTLPWWSYFLTQLRVGLGTAADFPLWGQVVGGFSLKNIALIPIKFLIGRVTLDNKSLYAVSILVMAIVLVIVLINAFKQLSRKSKLIHFIPLLWLTLPILIGIVLTLKISLLSYFRFLFVLPAFYVLITQGLSFGSKRITTLVLVFFLLLNTITTTAYITQPRFHRENWREFSLWIESHSTNSAVTVIPNLAQADPYLFYQKKVPIVDQLELVEKLPDSFYLVRYLQEIFDPQDQLRLQIEQLDYKLIEQKHFNGIVVWHYQRTDRLFAANIEAN